MATAITPFIGALTYEAYLAEPPIEGRYDIINGARVFMSEATWEHQTISGNLYDALRHYSRASSSGTALYAPFDILIRRAPKLQTRPTCCSSVLPALPKQAALPPPARSSSPPNSS